MQIGSKRNHGNNEYIFIDGVAMRADEAVRVQLDQADIATLASASSVPQPAEAQLMVENKRSMRRKCVVFGIALLALFLASLCVSAEYYARFYSPVDVLQCALHLPKLAFLFLADQGSYTIEHQAVVIALPMYDDFVARLMADIKFIFAGALLAVSGMLYQSAFRNPIAAPSMLGVSNGVSLALVVLVLQYGAAALSMIGQYYVYSFIGGALILALVVAGGYLSSEKGHLNTVNMLLIGTVVSQLVGVIISYLQTSRMGDTSWTIYYQLQTAVGLTTQWTYITLIGGAFVALVPVFVLRFRLNLISFSDAETRLLGVNPTALRLVALGCGSLMVLVAQVNVGQVAMASLVLPFVSRAVFGSEFRKQLAGNILLGGILLLVCGVVVQLVIVNGVPVDLGTVVTVIALPLFVWMLVIRQKNWGD